jgi:hypothetical protein
MTSGAESMPSASGAPPRFSFLPAARGRPRKRAIPNTASSARLRRSVSDEIEVLRAVAERLEAADIEYMLTGSVAMAWYAQPRQTRDIDIVVELPESKVDAVLKSFTDDFYVDADVVRQEVRRRGMFNMIENARIVKVDMILRKPTPYASAAFGRRRRVELVPGLPISIISPEDLVLAKLQWGAQGESDLQLRDVRNLVHSVQDLDATYLSERASELGVTSLLERARGE